MQSSIGIVDLRKKEGNYNEDEYAIILDYLPKGYARSKHTMPVAQAVTTNTFTLLELKPKQGVAFNIGEKVYIGKGERDKVESILRRLSYRNLTGTAQTELEKAVERIILENERRFVDFFNTAESINIREHQLDLLPGMGKKMLWNILEERKKKPFESFEDIKSRVQNITDPKKLIIKRVLEEIKGEEKVYLFVRPPSFKKPGLKGLKKPFKRSFYRG